jgi:hypothetical protein
VVLVEAHVDQLAARLARVAAGVQESAAELGRLDGVAWSSLAADRFRAVLAEASARAAAAAEETEQAAWAMSRHARALREADPLVVLPGPSW